MPRARMLTYEESHAIAIAPLPRVHGEGRFRGTVTYTGKIWGGVQVADTFYNNFNSEGLWSAKLVKNVEYDGIYKDSVNITAKDAVDLFADLE